MTASFQSKEDANRRGIHFGNFPIEKGYQKKVVHVGKLFYCKVIQFSTCSDPDRFVKFNRKGGVNKQQGGGKFS